MGGKRGAFCCFPKKKKRDKKTEAPKNDVADAPLFTGGRGSLKKRPSSVDRHVTVQTALIPNSQSEDYSVKEEKPTSATVQKSEALVPLTEQFSSSSSSSNSSQRGSCSSIIESPGKEKEKINQDGKKEMTDDNAQPTTITSDVPQSDESQNMPRRYSCDISDQTDQVPTQENKTQIMEKTNSKDSLNASQVDTSQVDVVLIKNQDQGRSPENGSTTCEKTLQQKDNINHPGLVEEENQRQKTEDQKFIKQPSSLSSSESSFEVVSEAQSKSSSSSSSDSEDESLDSKQEMAVDKHTHVDVVDGNEPNDIATKESIDTNTNPGSSVSSIQTDDFHDTSNYSDVYLSAESIPRRNTGRRIIKEETTITVTTVQEVTVTCAENPEQSVDCKIDERSEKERKSSDSSSSDSGSYEFVDAVDGTDQKVSVDQNTHTSPKQPQEQPESFQILNDENLSESLNVKTPPSEKKEILSDPVVSKKTVLERSISSSSSSSLSSSSSESPTSSEYVKTIISDVTTSGGVVDKEEEGSKESLNAELALSETPISHQYAEAEIDKIEENARKHNAETSSEKEEDIDHFPNESIISSSNSSDVDTKNRTYKTPFETDKPLEIITVPPLSENSDMNATDVLPSELDISTSSSSNSSSSDSESNIDDLQQLSETNDDKRIQGTEITLKEQSHSPQSSRTDEVFSDDDTSDDGGKIEDDLSENGKENEPVYFDNETNHNSLDLKISNTTQNAEKVFQNPDESNKVETLIENASNEELDDTIEIDVSENERKLSSSSSSESSSSDEESNSETRAGDLTCDSSDKICIENRIDEQNLEEFEKDFDVVTLDDLHTGRYEDKTTTKQNICSFPDNIDQNEPSNVAIVVVAHDMESSSSHSSARDSYNENPHKEVENTSDTSENVNESFSENANDAPDDAFASQMTLIKRRSSSENPVKYSEDGEQEERVSNVAVVAIPSSSSSYSSNSESNSRNSVSHSESEASESLSSIEKLEDKSTENLNNASGDVSKPKKAETSEMYTNEDDQLLIVDEKNSSSPTSLESLITANQPDQITERENDDKATMVSYNTESEDDSAVIEDDIRKSRSSSSSSSDSESLKSKEESSSQASNRDDDITPVEERDKHFKGETEIRDHQTDEQVLINSGSESKESSDHIKDVYYSGNAANETSVFLSNISESSSSDSESSSADSTSQEELAKSIGSADNTIVEDLQKENVELIEEKIAHDEVEVSQSPSQREAGDGQYLQRGTSPKTMLMRSSSSEDDQSRSPEDQNKKDEEANFTLNTDSSMHLQKEDSLHRTLSTESRSSSTSSSSSSSNSSVEQAEVFSETKNTTTLVITDFEEKVNDDSKDVESCSSNQTIPPSVIRKKRENIVFKSGWRKVVQLIDLLSARLVTEKTVKSLESGAVDEAKVARDLHKYLHGEEPIAGLLIMESGEKMSLFDASTKRIIRRGTAVSLLEAQAATGSIINPYSGEKMSVDEATKTGLIDKFLASVLIRAERAACGFQSKLQTKPLSLFEAMKKNLVVESHGIRLLEAQIATGGIIDPRANHRIPVDVAFERGLFDERLNKILEDPSDDTKGFFDPNTNQNLTYLQLIERCTVDKQTSLKLLPIYKGKQKKDYWKKSK